jgi:hypothetical protein
VRPFSCVRSYIFDDICLAINLCNATERVINLLGEYDFLGSFDGLPVPFMHFYQNLNCTIGPRHDVNQSLVDVVVRGMAGMDAPTCGNFLSNPLGLFVTITAIPWVHNCSIYSADPVGDPYGLLVPIPTWDFRNPALNTTNIALTYSSFNGNGTQAAPPFYGAALDPAVIFANNLLANYSAASALGVGTVTFISRECANDVFIESNTFEYFYGQALEVLNYGALTVFSNNFLGCGGSNLTVPDRRWVAHVECCVDGQPGTIIFQQNQQTTNLTGIATDAVVVCDVPLWSTYYIDPVNWDKRSQCATPNPATDTKSFILANNQADGGLCVGLRLWNTTQNCGKGLLGYSHPNASLRPCELRSPF